MKKNQRKKTYILRKIFSMFLFLSLFISIYSADNYNSYEYLQVEIENTLTYGIDTKENTYIDSLFLKSYFFPENYNGSQALNSFESSDIYSLKNDEISSYLEYDIKNKINQENKITNTFIIQSTIDKPKISQKILFPQTSLNTNYIKYTEFSELIDSNEAIINQASLLAQGEDDTYIIASKIAKWIQEDITYDLSTITANPNQKSSDVFTSKLGVCKEITHLYISMMRSLGIPAKVVTGYAYTNSQEVIDLVGSNWGGHAWAEVLIGDTWVPFDLTYNQYGYVDASHIVLDKSKEIRTQSAAIDGKGREFDIIPKSLKNKNNFIVLDQKERIIDPGFKVLIEGPRKLSPGSYGHIKVRVENTQDYYQNIFLNLAKVKEVELLDSSKQMIILNPLEVKEILFRYKIPELEKGFKYTFPFTIYNQFFEGEFILEVESGNEIISEHILPKIEVKSNSYSNNNLEIICEGIVSNPQNTLFCSIKNPNNYELYNINICNELSCQKIGLKVNEQKSIEIKTNSFTSNVSLKYLEKEEKITISIPQPFLIQKNISIEKQKVSISYDIENNYEALTSKIIINSKIRDEVNLKSIKNEYMLNPGKYIVEIQILNGEEIIDTYTEIIIIEELNIIEKIIKFFKELFMVFF